MAPPGAGAARLVPACLWTTRPDLIIALDARFGPPVDAYVNGSQVWLRDDGPGGMTLEWRLHPVGAYRPPHGLDTYDVFDVVAAALARGEEGPASPDTLWGGLEAFAAYGDEVEPAVLAAACTEALGPPPDASGLVDHVSVGDAWERSGRSTSLFGALLEQLSGPSPEDPTP